MKPFSPDPKPLPKIGNPKPRARYVASEEEWTLLHRVVSALQSGLCGCGCGRKGESLHHLVKRSQGGDDVISCLVLLSGDGTRGCHGALETGDPTHDPEGRRIEPESVRRGIRRLLRADQKVYIEQRLGDWYLAKNYPE